MAEIIDMRGRQLFAVIEALVKGVPLDIGERLVGNPRLLEHVIERAREYLTRRLRLTVPDQLEALRRASEYASWKIPESEFTRLAETAPDWPMQEGGYRSLRIRFGRDSEGVLQTFNEHLAQLRRVFEADGLRWPPAMKGHMISWGKQTVPSIVLRGGDCFHVPTLEWIIIDADAHRQRKSLRDLPMELGLADELLVLAWMCPELIRAIDHDRFPALIATGYEFRSEGDDKAIQALMIDYPYPGRMVHLCRLDMGNNSERFSVPNVVRKK